MYVAIIMLAEKDQMHTLDSHAYILSVRRLQFYFEVTEGVATGYSVHIVMCTKLDRP